MITLLRFEVNLPLFPLQYQFTKSDPSCNRIEYAVILFIDIMYFDNRICRLILNTMQGFICKRIVKQSGITRSYPKAIHITALNQFINRKFFIPSYIRHNILLTFRRVNCNGRSLLILTIIRYMQQSITLRPEP